MNGHRFTFSYGICCRVPGLGSLIQFLHRLPLLMRSSTFSCPLYSCSSNILVEEMAHGGDHGKHPHNEDSSRGPPAPPLDVDGAGRSLGECGKEVIVYLSFAIGDHVY
jgi:hypothetical protein